MQIVYNPDDLKLVLDKFKAQFKSIGFVPTMGALHQGHISLIDKSRSENDITVCSIFVNPLQFNNANDLKLYPRTADADTKMLEEAGCDVLFMPEPGIIYAKQPKIKLDFGTLESVMEGKFRPGHFNGMAIIVAKLFHYVAPDKAYFGQKDLQQFLIIQRMVQDLSFRIKLVCCDIIRESDGLAMSSRNKRLEPVYRNVSPELFKSLLLAKDLLKTQSPAFVKQKVAELFADNELINLEYFEIADGESLEPVNDVSEHEKVALCIAAFLGDVRLIDNIVFEPSKG